MSVILTLFAFLAVLAGAGLLLIVLVLYALSHVDQVGTDQAGAVTENPRGRDLLYGGLCIGGALFLLWVAVKDFREDDGDLAVCAGIEVAACLATEG